MEEEYIKDIDLEKNEKKGLRERFNDFLTGRYFVAVALVLVAIIGFSLGRISGLQDKRVPVRVISGSGEVKGVNTEVIQEQVQSSQNATAGAVVASKSGTKYHYPWCAGAKQISAKNLVTFNSIEEARSAGYTPASNCKGLK